MVQTSISYFRVPMLFLFFVNFHSVGAQQQPLEVFSNSAGLKMIPIPAGTFEMGNPNPRIDGWDEGPVHKVTFEQPFFLSETEVTLEQFRAFRPDFNGAGNHPPYVTGLSWFDATAYCDWLSKQEGKNYRLPTEAEWEYACRAGTDTPFWSGEEPPSPDAPNPWGLKNLHHEPLEWCWDWYGPYSMDQQTDPVGPADGMAKAIRGGGLDSHDKSYARSHNRAGMAPAFGIIGSDSIDKGKADPTSQTSDTGKKGIPGHHSIGFRVVLGQVATTKPTEFSKSFVSECVIQKQPQLTQGPDPGKPWFRKRPLLPMPPDNVPREETRRTGLHPGMMFHNHSPALEVCPNGDLLMIIYTSEHEYEPEVSLMATRLRFGSDEWDMPEILLNFPDVNDHAPCLYSGGNTMYVFWGNPRLDSAFPFQWRTSSDNGASWSLVHFPHFMNDIGPHSRQPINTVLRGGDGTLYVPSDGEGGTSVLWASKDDGQTWYDTEGRSAGRHTTYAFLKDGRILGMGGKNTDIDGYMPRALSSDGGKTWEVSKTPFSEQGANQRPCLIRLQSGRLFFCADLQHSSGKHPDALPERGAFIALSEDEGETWTIKKMTGTQPHENPQFNKNETLGYSVARQAPNGVIHVIATMTTPCLHYELNEAWILSKEAGLMEQADPVLRDLKEFQEKYPSGQVKAAWGAGVAQTGEYLLNGPQTWSYENGQKQWEVTYTNGLKTGMETYWNPAGKVLWSWNHEGDGKETWTQYWPNGKKKSESEWRGFMAQGTAKRWSPEGVLVDECLFKDGRLAE
jgi:hypothetical protein